MPLQGMSLLKPSSSSLWRSKSAPSRKPDSAATHLIDQGGTFLVQAKAQPTSKRGRERTQANLGRIDRALAGILRLMVRARPSGSDRSSQKRCSDRFRQATLSAGGLAMGLAIRARRHPVHGEIISWCLFLPDECDAQEVGIEAGVNSASEVQDDPPRSQVVSGPLRSKVPRIEGLAEEGGAILAVGPVGGRELRMLVVLSSGGQRSETQDYEGSEE